MVNRRTLDKRTSCMSDEEARRLTALGGVVRPYCWSRPARDLPGVRVLEVLCFNCGYYHHPDGVLTCMALPRKSASVENSPSSTSSALDAGLLRQYSEIWGFLTSTAYEDGTSRRTGRLSLCFESGILKLSLNDEETGQYACLSGRQMDGILTEVELRLADGTMPWRASQYQRKGRR